ncbi:MAG: phosphatidate cytidylyltransferase [Phycisphaerales bacterium]|nr:phosphatidate cytidylyltransferase [Phycisphaerales bacterium]
MLLKRVITGCSLIILLLAVVWLDGVLSNRGARLTTWSEGRWQVGLVAVITLLAFSQLAIRELVRFARARQYAVMSALAHFGAAGFVVGPYVVNAAGWNPALWWEGFAAWLTALIIAGFVGQMIRARAEGALAAIAVTTLVTLYGGAFGAFLIAARIEVGGWAGIAVVLYSLLLVKVTDIGAFFSGSLLGRTRLIAWLSPKKTIEGLVGGIVTTMVAAAALQWILSICRVEPQQDPPLNSIVALVLFGLVMAGFSVFGDLCASLLKRDAGFKDSGDALPGLGGVLDVFDSPILAAPAIWLFWTRVAPAVFVMKE